MSEYLLDYDTNGLRLANCRNGQVQFFDFEGVAFHGQMRHAIYLGRVVDILQAGCMAFVDIGLDKPGVLSLKEKNFPSLSRGDNVVCQITREEDLRDGKGVHLTRNVSISMGPVMYTPFHLGGNVSKKMSDSQLADEFMTHIKEEGVILRQWADAFDLPTLLHILEYLRRKWQEIQSCINQKPPVKLKAASTLLERLINSLTPGDTIVCNDKLTAQKLESLLIDTFGGGPEITLEKGTLFHDDILDQWDSLTQIYIAVPGGGELIIEETAALVSIDINNAGANSSGHDLNRRALKEVFRQIKLRNLAGIIMVDLAGNIKHPKQLIQSARNLADSDTHIHGITDLGLLEISRRKSGPSLTQLLKK